jgi:hypothetical protein
MMMAICLGTFAKVEGRDGINEYEATGKASAYK